MKRYNLINNALGWVCFFVAALTYLLTVEPTASFWDCPEFILQGAKLEVGHPPGNPIFMLAARFFITLFGGSMTSAALAVNCMSALLSAGTILLLFWSITHLVRKLIVKDDAETIDWWKTTLIMAGGVCGALAYTWSDTFWFSAVEGEVYAFSSFCTALVFWLMLKWENRADNPSSDRYLILIAYIIGVSIAVHLLNLLCIPALGLIFYYRKWSKANAIGSLIALGVSCIIVGAILYGLVPGFIQVAQWFELMFVNGFGMSYNMGVLIYAIVLVGVFCLTIKALYARRSPGRVRLLFLLSVGLSGMPFIGHSVLVGVVVLLGLAVYLWMFCRPLPVRILTIITMSIFVIFVGYSSYALLLIRASANTPMNQNAPDNVFALASYLNREQYGDRPLFKGPVFAETLVEQEYPEGSGTYYVVVDEQGRPRTRVLDSYLRNERGSAFNEPTSVYTKVVKSHPLQPDKYVAEIERPSYKTLPDLDMFFTRIYSNDPDGRHVSGYKSWSGYSTPDINYIPEDVRKKWAQQGFAPRYEVVQYLPGLVPVTTAINEQTGAPTSTAMVWKPGFDVNLSYFINYQLNHMYWRYFMWNFAGRQNDLQGNGEPHLGNWISGIPAIDNARLGDQTYLPDEFGKGNKGHNVFYMLPLILGLIGLLWQAMYKHRLHPERGIQQFWVVFFLFFMTGIAIVLYLNQTPGQPRERDYAFAGSFYAFAIWIGLGVPALGIMLRNMLAGKTKEGEQKEPSQSLSMVSAAVACVVALGVPLQMVSQTWDDHDRSGRYTTRDFGFNYLASLDENAIIFTNGDNDTFPLWYAQEVEGFRPDVRVVNLSYLTTDWYANQMQLPTSGADAIPMQVRPQDYGYERLAYSFVVGVNKNQVPAKLALDSLYKSDSKRFGAPILTSPNMIMKVDKDAAVARYTTGVAAVDSLLIAPKVSDITVNFSSNGGLNQSKVLSLDMIANSVDNNWNRPTYFATTVPSSYYLGLTPYLEGVGMAYEVTPFRNAVYQPTADKAYARIVNDYRWGGLDVPGAEGLYLDETVRRMAASVRSGVYSVVESLMASGDAPATEMARKAAVDAGLKVPENRYDMARQLLHLLNDKMPIEVVQHDGIIGLYMARSFIDLYLVTGDKADLEAAEKIINSEADRYAQLIKYATSLDPQSLALLNRSEGYTMQYLSEAVSLKNYVDILKALPGLDEDAKAKIASTNLDFDLRLAPLIFIDNYKLETLAVQRDKLTGAHQALIDNAIGILSLNQRAGVDATAFTQQLMQKYGFTPEEWNRVLD